jgi:hypothetical protein
LGKSKYEVSGKFLPQNPRHRKKSTLHYMTITSKLDIVHSMWVENCVYEFAGKIPLMEVEIQPHNVMFPK